MHSIRNSIISRLLVGLAILFLFFGVVLDYLLSSKFEQEFDRVTLAKAASLVTLTRYTDEGLEFDFAEEFMPEFSPAKPHESADDKWYFQVWRHDDTLLEKSESLGDHDLTKPYFKDNTNIHEDTVLWNGLPGRQVAVTFVAQIEDEFYESEAFAEIDTDVLQQPVFLVVSRSRQQLITTISTLHLLLVTIGTLITILVIILVSRAVTRGMAPMGELQLKMEAFDVNTLQDRLSLRLPVAELDGTVRNFNGMLNRLESGFERERRFSSDVAHELRTPIAEIKNLAQVSIRWPEDEKISASFHQDILSAAVQMEMTVNNLLALARSDVSSLSESVTESLELLELKTELSRITNQFGDLATTRTVNVTTTTSGDCHILTVLPYMKLLLQNILGNAFQYCEKGSTVQISIDCRESDFTVCVTNKAINLHHDDTEVMFDRLWRKDAARSDGGHSGLGLALVKNYSEILGYQISTELVDQIFSLSVTGSNRRENNTLPIESTTI